MSEPHADFVQLVKKPISEAMEDDSDRHSDVASLRHYCLHFVTVIAAEV
jgi:hypothetical protein